jgi:hypothetical protein
MEIKYYSAIRATFPFIKIGTCVNPFSTLTMITHVSTFLSPNIAMEFHLCQRGIGFVLNVSLNLRPRRQKTSVVHFALARMGHFLTLPSTSNGCITHVVSMDATLPLVINYHLIACLT